MAFNVRRHLLNKPASHPTDGLQAFYHITVTPMIIVRVEKVISSVMPKNKTQPKKRIPNN
jgi:hypothetical protein